MEAGDFLGVAVAGRGEHDGPGDDVLGAPAFAAVIQLIEPADKERGAREQNHREGKLPDDERLTEAAMAAAASHAARGALQRLVDIEPQGEKRRRQTEGDAQ